MTRNRSWLALGALLLALAGGALWAADQKKADKSQTGDCCAEGKGCCAEKCCTKEKACCEEKCSAAEKGCCEGKCCTKEKGKCCGCCEKAPQMATFPVPAGSAVQVMIAPPGAFEGDGPAGWLTTVPAPPAPCPMPVPFTPATPFTPAPCAMPPAEGPMPSPVTPVTQYILDSRVVPPPPTQPGPSVTSYVVPPVPPALVAPRSGYAHDWRVCVVQEDGKSCLGMQAGPRQGASATFESMTLKVGGGVKLSVVGKQVRVSGKCVNATADSVSWGPDHGDIVLAGSVKVKYECDAHKAEITAQQVVVGVLDGHIEVVGTGNLNTPKTSPVSTGSPTPTAPRSCPACPALSGEAQQLFNFWTSFTR